MDIFLIHEYLYYRVGRTFAYYATLGLTKYLAMGEDITMRGSSSLFCWGPPTCGRHEQMPMGTGQNPHLS